MVERNYAAELTATPPAQPAEMTYAQRISNFFRPWTDEERAQVAAVMPPDLAPTQIVKGMVGGAANLAMQANEAMPWGGNNPQAIGYDPQAGTIDPSKMIPFATDVAGMATTGSLAAPAVGNGLGMGIRAYHGSPHDFDRFSMDKIGTGEGAQAYGHGLYFAENEGVARNYRDALQFKAPVQADGSAPAGPMAIVANAVRDARKYPEPERSDALRRWLDETEAMASGPYAPPDMLQSVKEARRLIDSGEVKPDLGPAGRMYEVDINASPDEFLDWDKPLSEQPESIRRALLSDERMQDVLAMREWSGSEYEPPSGEWVLKGDAGDSAYRMLSDEFGGYDKAAEALRAAGIKGIRYKDAGSRATSGGELLGVERGADGWKAKVRVTNRSGVGIQAPADMVTTSKAFPSEAEARQWAESKIGGGTSNFVVFDDNIIDILKKYGIAGLTAGGAGAAMLGGTGDASASAPSYSTGGRF